MKSLFKKSFIWCFALFAISCSKNDVITKKDPSSENSTTIPAESDFSLKIKAEEGRVGGYANFQAGEVIRYAVTITDSKDTDATYVLTPEGDNQQKHQILDTDYVLNKYTQNVPIPTNKITISNTEKQNFTFSIKILKPGTFTLKFNLQKMAGGQKVGNPLSENVLFSAVSFYAYSNYGFVVLPANIQTNCFGVRQNTRWDREFFYQIDCGDQITDNYLYDSGFTYTYSTNWCGGGTSGNLSRGNNLFYRRLFAGADNSNYCSTGPLNEISYNGHSGYIIDEIKIFQKSTNGSINNTISYKNIPITAEYRTL